MSAKKTSLNSPATIAVVVVLLVVVGVFNFETFGGQSSSRKSSRGYRVQAHPAVPSDVRSLVNRELTMAVMQQKTTPAVVREKLRRDPFHPRVNHPLAAENNTSSVQLHGSLAATTSSDKALQCAAVMLGGKKSMAIIDGQGRFLGETLRGLTVTGIDADGVTLMDPQGLVTYLPVGVDDSTQGFFRVVTQSIKTGNQGYTRLVDKK